MFDHAGTTPESVPAEFVPALEAVLSQDDRIDEFVRHASASLREVYLLGSGASYYGTWPAWHLLTSNAVGISAWHLTSGEFITTPPRRLGANSLVIAASHAGRTEETVRAARLARAAGATVAAITRHPDSPLAAAADAVFAYPSDRAIVESKLLLFQQFGYALLDNDPGRTRHAGQRPNLAALPSALAALRASMRAPARDIATNFSESELVYVLGAGPSFGAANTFAACYLQEMQWMHAAAVHAADFLHGPFEVITKDTAVVVLLAEDDSRQLTERALRFVLEHSGNVVTVDSKDFALPTIPAAERAELSPLVVASAARGLLEHLACIRGHDPTQRRYMYRIDY